MDKGYWITEMVDMTTREELAKNPNCKRNIHKHTTVWHPLLHPPMEKLRKNPKYTIEEFNL
jgi:hypothetical protein